MLDQLYYFSEVYRNRSISRAADFLHISRQALSHSVKGLEQELGVELFVREKDGVVPTKAADSLYESAQVILREEAQIRENMLSFTHKSADIRQYTIAASMFYVNSYGETLITQLAQRFPTDMFILKTIKNSDDSITRQTDINIQLKLSKQNKKSMKCRRTTSVRSFCALQPTSGCSATIPLLRQRASTIARCAPIP